MQQARLFLDCSQEGANQIQVSITLCSNVVWDHQLNNFNGATIQFDKATSMSYNYNLLLMLLLYCIT